MKRYRSETYIGNGKTVGVQAPRNSKVEELHCHDFIEIVYVTSGSAIHRIDGADYRVSRGDILFINYGATHAFRPLENFRYINISFLPELLSGTIIRENTLALLSLTVFDEMRRDQNGGKLSFFDGEREEVEWILRAMLRERGSPEPYADRVLESYLNVLLTKMLRRSAAGVDPNPDMWQALETFICNNLEEPLSLPMLAKRCFYNPSYFSRAFKQKMGCSLSEYLRRKRMEQAQKLLRETEMPVDAVMTRVGYSDRSAFYHVFSRTVGLTPAQFRLRCKNDPQKK